MQPVDATVASASRQRLARRAVRSRAWLAWLLLALVGAQWFAVAHRAFHASGAPVRAAHAAAAGVEAGSRVAPAGPAADAIVTALSRAFDDHPAAGSDCRRLDGLLGAQPVPGAVATVCLVACPDRCPIHPLAAVRVATLVRAPPARAPPPVLA